MTSPQSGEERGLERRVFELERNMTHILQTTAITEAVVTGLKSTIDSRFASFDRGIDLILERLKAGDSRIENLEAIKNQALGAIIFVKVLGITGIIGGVISIVRLVLTK